MAQQNPIKISVALCTYNGESFIEEQLNSILSQNAPVNEIVIGDDCSVDNTWTILEKYKKFFRLFSSYIKTIITWGFSTTLKNAFLLLQMNWFF